jgi:hypothetical protein
MAETGKEAESLGVQTALGRDFAAKQGKRFIQQMDPSARDWMKEGNPLFKKLVEQLGKVWQFDDLKAIGESLKSMAAQPLDRPAAFEFERTIPMLPAAIVDDAGRLHPILKHDVLPTAINTANPVAKILESQWMRLGGIKHLGQDVTKVMIDSPDAAQGILETTKLGQSLQSGGENVVNAASRMLGAIYHRPEAGYTGLNTSNWWINKSRDYIAQGIRSIAGRAVPALNLTGQWLSSATQTLNEVPAVTGAMNYAKALAKTIFKYSETNEAAKAAGAIQEKFLLNGAKVWDRHRPFESFVNGVTDRIPTEKLNDFVKDFHDTVAYTAGEYKAQQMLTRPVKQSEFLLMDEMNLPQKDVQDVFRNPAAFDEEAKNKAVQSFARAVTKETQFHSKNAALKGRFENDSVMRYVLPYQSYLINTLKRSVKDMERIVSTSKGGVDPNSNIISQTIQRLNPFGSAKESYRNAISRAVLRTLGIQASGEFIADVSAAGQGKDGLREDRSGLGRFLENLSYAGFLGPAHFALDMVGSHLLEGQEAKDFASGHAGSRAPSLANPALEAAGKTGKALVEGDVGKAAWEATGGQAPLAGKIARGTGLMEPVGGAKGGAARGPNPWSGLGTVGAKKNAAPNPWSNLGTVKQPAKAKPNPWKF